MFNSNFVRDALERVVVTGVEATLAVLLLDMQDNEIAVDGVKVALIAGLAAGLAAVKAIAARWVGDRDSASLVAIEAPGPSLD